ncbi:peptide ABC transporter substrate-binding protein [Clostridium tagluense]|uniref:peptide ABC transporter substrate-binding protein n=1 Tax=Clostridium tagluense TaxID=360422 RepID=UPI001C6F3909|nr:peptide ABC transporter substrate-binding protein [Clostridium tagluense]MBW9158080.1 peptide ABC transporter substrate-binding protein [Clostridium tagluense]WLC65074.1 peptide ABC transporter substrate-binding protein [Clostridium tagluense]
MKRLLCIILIFIMMLSSGCVEKKVKPTNSRKYLVYNLGEVPSDLLMLNSDNVREKDLLLALFEGLVREDKYGEIVPAMAEKFDISVDKIGYTFKLRKDLHYSDGRSIKAIDFVRFFHNILLEKNNVFAEQLYCIFGAKDFSMGKVKSDKVAISAKDDLTLEIRLNSPNDYFLNILSNPVFTLRETNMNKRNWKNSYEDIQYSGPFIIKEINEYGEIYLLRNEKYWRKSEIVSNEMLFTTIKDEEKTLADFETTRVSDTSKIDVFVSPPISEGKSLSMKKKTIAVPTKSMYYLTFNLNTKDTVKDNSFRNAISAIISKEFIIQTISKDLAVPAINYTTSSVVNEDSSKLIFDVFGSKDKGAKYLKEYLKTHNYEKKAELIIVYENKNLDDRIAKEIAKNIKENLDEIAKNIKGYLDLKDYLDVNVVCKGYAKDELNKVTKQGDYNILFSKIDEEYGDIYKLLSRWTSSSSYNIYGYKDLEYDKTIKSALLQKDKKNKIKLYNEAQEILAKDLPCIPVYIVNTVICKKENVKGIYTTKVGNLIFDYAYKEDNTSAK